MRKQAKLNYSMLQKKKRIIEYRDSLTNLLRYLYLGYFALVITLIPIFFNHEHFKLSFDMSDNIFPNLRKVDVWLLIIVAALGLYLTILSGKHKRMKSKYELLRHDIMKDLDSTLILSRLCQCDGACDCRESFVQEMNELGIDLIFKKYKSEQKMSM